MIDERFVILGVLLVFYGALHYIIDTLKGKTKPNRVTWFFWALAPGIAFIAELDKGVGYQSLFTFIAGFNPFLILIASFVNKNAYWKLHRADYFYGFIALMAIVLWRITGDANLAILFAILADGAAAIPTVIKSYYKPETENYKIFFYCLIGAVITLLTLKVWTFAHYAFPVYLLGICTILYVLIKFKAGILIQKRISKSSK